MSRRMGSTKSSGGSAKTPMPVVKPSSDVFGAEAMYSAPAPGEEMDITTGIGARVPWPEVQRQLQLFVSNSATDPKSAARGRTFLRDFDVLSNVTTVSEGLELLYYMHRLSYPSNSKLEASLVEWLIDNIPLITTIHLLDMCRYAIEQGSFEYWKRVLLLSEPFIPHMMELLALDGGGAELTIEDYVLVARVLQHSREELEAAQSKSLMPGIESAKKKPIFRVIVQSVASLLIDGSSVGSSARKGTADEDITPEVVGNVLKHIATLDISCPAQGRLVETLRAVFSGSTAVDAMRYLTAMSESGAVFPALLVALVDRIDQHARKALEPAPTAKGSRKIEKKASVKAIREAAPEDVQDTEAIVDVTYITRAFLLIAKITRGADRTIADKLLLTLRPAVDTIQKLLRQRARLLADPPRLTRLLSDLVEVSDILTSEVIGPDDPMVASMRAFVPDYVSGIDTAIQQGAPIDNLMLEECGFCLRIASRVMDHSITAEVAAKVEELCGRFTEANTNTKEGPQMSLEGSLRVIEGLAAVGSFPPKIVDLCVRVCLENRSQLTSRQVSAVIFVAGLCGGAKFEPEVFHQLTGRLLNTAKFRRNDVLGPNAVAQLLRGLAAAGIAPDERLQAFLSDQALRYTSEFSVRDSTSLLIVVHQLKLDQSTVGQRLGIEVAASIPPMNADDLVRLSSVMAELNLRDVCMLDAIGYRLRDCLGELKPRHLVEFAMSLRELNFTSMFAKCGLADLVPAVKDLAPNEASFLMAFCPPPVQELIISKFICNIDTLKQLNPASLITVYGAAPDHMDDVREAALTLLVGKECPLTVSGDVACLAICRTITATHPQLAMAAMVNFLNPVANKISSTQIEVIVEQLRRAIVEAVPAAAMRANVEREQQMEKEDKLMELSKERTVEKTKGVPLRQDKVLEKKLSVSLRGSTFVVPAAFYRFFGRRVCANIDFLSAETCVSLLEIYMHGKVRDDRVIKAIFRRLAKNFRPVLNSPRLTRLSIMLVDFFSLSWAGQFGSILKARTSHHTRDTVHTKLL